MGVTFTHTAQCGPSPLQSSHTAGPVVFNFRKDHIFLLNFYPGLFNDSPASSFQPVYRYVPLQPARCCSVTKGIHGHFLVKVVRVVCIPRCSAQRCASTSGKCVYGNHPARHFVGSNSLSSVRSIAVTLLSRKLAQR